MNIDHLLDSSEYQCKLSEHLTSLLKRVRKADNEAQIAFAFQSEIYFFVRDFLGKEVDFGQESNQTTLRHKFVGRMDALCNSLVIEYKRGSKLISQKDKDNATKQISEYIYQLKESEKADYNGVLTDGLIIKYIYTQNGKICSTPFKKIDESDLDKIVRALIDSRNKKFLPRNIVADFKIAPESNVLKLSKILFNYLNEKSDNKTIMLYQEWKSLFHLSENDKGQNSDIEKRRNSLGKIFDTNINDNENDYKALFSLQTTYAIIIKLIACKVITKIEFNKEIEYFSDLSVVDQKQLRQFFIYTEDGYIFQNGKIKNLLEGDFFSWYCSETLWDSSEIFDVFIDIINTLEGYSNAEYMHGYHTIDIFIDLYMEIMPPEVRHSLGEYFTPSWLADKVIKNSINLIPNQHNYVAIDPTCGSGIFVISLIKNIIGDTDIVSLNDSEKDKLLENIINRVKGVDINPLSVLTAKVGFYIAIKPLVKNLQIEIPIYLGDSANIPSVISLDTIDCYEYSIKTELEDINVVLPKKFVENKNFFSCMSKIQSIIKTEDDELVKEKFLSFIGSENINTEIVLKINSLSKQLVRLHKKEWDGIWIRIVANFMLVGRIKDIDLIVGNPPWVKWEFLPQEYAEKIKSLCLQKHLFSGQTYMGAISLNICALIANVTASSWLKESGILAFLMPQTLMTQDSYAGFRNFYIDKEMTKRMYLKQMDDWTKSGNPFVDTTEKFMTYYYTKSEIDYFNKGIPIECFVKKRNISIQEINSHHLFSDVDNYFLKSKATAFQLDRNRTGYTTVSKESISLKKEFDLIIGTCEYKARSGVEFTPAEIYFIEPLKKSNNLGQFIFKHSEFKNSKYKNINAFPFEVETNYIRPVIKAPDIYNTPRKTNNFLESFILFE